MAKKKLFLDDKSGKARRKTLDELKKKGIELEDEDKISGGAANPPQWLESNPGSGTGAIRPEPGFPG